MTLEVPFAKVIFIKVIFHTSLGFFECTVNIFYIQLKLEYRESLRGVEVESLDANNVIISF
jgi:hypothetical protein